MAAANENETDPPVRPSDYGGPGYTEVQIGHRFACENTPGHETHAAYEDHNVVLVWQRTRGHVTDPHRITEINGHPVAVVTRTVTYGPWDEESGSDEVAAGPERGVSPIFDAAREAAKVAAGSGDDTLVAADAASGVWADDYRELLDLLTDETISPYKRLDTARVWITDTIDGPAPG